MPIPADELILRSYIPPFFHSIQFYDLNAILTITIFTRLSQKRIISLWKGPTS